MNRSLRKPGIAQDRGLLNTLHRIIFSQPFTRLDLFLLLAVSLFTYLPSAQAKDLQGRLGLGYNAQLSNLQYTNGEPGLSLKYGLTRDIAVEGIVSINTGGPTNTATGIKFFKNIFYEMNLNFYFMLGGAIASVSSPDSTGVLQSHSGAEFLTGFGAEFFIPGIDSLGFAMETGGSFDNLNGSFALKTMGVSFLNAGIHFYF
jgi:hypothetical protein